MLVLQLAAARRRNALGRLTGQSFATLHQMDHIRFSGTYMGKLP